MKRTFPILAAVFAALSGQTAPATELPLPVQPQAVHYALSAQASLPMPARVSPLPGVASLGTAPVDIAVAGARPGTQGPRLDLASLGGALPTGTPGPRAAPLQAGAAEGLADRLPSTPVALFSLLLIICILVGRRNRVDDI